MSEIIGTTLDAFMDAVTQQYGSDIWQGITSTQEFYAADFASKVTQVEGVSAMYNNAGEVLYYQYNGQIVGSAVDAGNIINSNVGSTVANTTVKVPANTTVATGGTVAASSGMKTVAAGSTVATTVGTVALAIGAVASGLQLGAKIDETLYNINPDFWDEHNMSSLDPQTWDTICSTEGGKSAYNFAFGIDKENDTTQAYMDATALAYMAKYMAVNGVFDFESEVTDYDPTTQYRLHFNTWNYPIKLWDSNVIVSTRNYFSTPYVSTVTINGADKIVGYVNPNTNPVSYSVSAIGIGQMPTIYEDFRGSTSEITGGTNTATINGVTYYQKRFNLPCPVNAPSGMPQNAANALNTFNDSYGDLIYLLYYNNDVIEGGGVEGITPQTGATLPSGITAGMTIPEVLTLLETQYPDLFDDAIYNDVVQPDGTTIRRVYVPVPIPDNISVDEQGNVQPTGGTEYGGTQADPTVTPTQSPDDIIETLLQIINATNPQNPTETPDTPSTDYPDTGTGNTPAIVMPTGSASALYSIYNPSQSQLNSFGAWLWSSNFVDQLLKIFNDPMQAIIGLHKVFATPATSGSGNIKVGYLDSGVSANLVSNQYTEVDCGTISLYEYFGNALDYTNTDVYIYLPFIGITPLNVLDVMRASINVKYKVDVVTGACLVSVNVNRDNNAGGQLYTYGGNCAVQYPLSSGSYMGVVAGILGVAGSVVGTIASGGALLPMALGVGASALSGSKTNVQHSGSISGSSGAMGIKKPYLIIRRPQTKIADGFEIFNGVSNNKTTLLSSCSGFTRVKYLHLENIPATDNELTEIETLLKDGIII